MMTKYGNRKTEVDGVVFASRAESRRYQELRLLEQAGEVTDLKLQPKFELQPKFKRDGKTIRAIMYSGDFAYTETSTGKRVVEDIKGGKGTQTQVFLLKSKLLLFRFPEIDFRIVAA